MSDDRVTVRLPYSVGQRLRTLAADRQTSVSALVREAAGRLADGEDPVGRALVPLNERELATVRRLDGLIVGAVERHPRAHRSSVYRRLRQVVRDRETQAALEPRI